MSAWVLVGLIGLHVTAIGFYEIYQRERLVLPMMYCNPRNW